MGPKTGFCSRDREHGANPHALSELSGSTLAIDMSIELHKALTKSDVCDQFHAEPTVPVTSILRHSNNIIDKCVQQRFG